MTAYQQARADMKRERISIVQPSRSERKVITRIVQQHSPKRKREG